MLDRWRLAIVFALFGFLASAVLILNGATANYSDLETFCAGELLTRIAGC